MDQQKAKLRDMLSDVRQKCQDETQMISSLKTQIQSQESDLKSQEDDLNRAKSELSRLQQEETQLEQSIQAGKVQLETIIKSLKSTQDEINQARSKLSQLHESHQEAHRSLEQYDEVLDGAHGASLTNLADLSEGVSLTERGGFGAMLDPFESSDPFSSSSVSSKGSGPFGTLDPFGSGSFNSAEGFADFSQMSKHPLAALSVGGRVGGALAQSAPGALLGGLSSVQTPDLWFLVQSPCTEETLIKGGQEPKRAAALLGAAYLETEPHGWDVWDIKDPHQGKSILLDSVLGGRQKSLSVPQLMPGCHLLLLPAVVGQQVSMRLEVTVKFGNEEQQLAWAKRESEKAEQERLARLRRQEQEDLELAIALSKADMPAA
ncbi:hypothetical protein CB1_000172012 [Camelus ferus]|nr:hypothetical protein CB1_000172012 [Camelus ferus]